MRELRQAISGRLGKQFAILIILFSSCFTLVSTSLQLAFDYRSDMHRIDEQFAMIQNSHVPSLSLGLWAMDSAQIDVHLEGLHQLPDIEHIELVEDHKTRRELGKKTSSNAKAHIYPLEFVRSPNTDPIYLGELVVTASIDNVYDRLLNRASVILISNGVKTFIVAGFIMLLIWFRVTRNLEAITAFVSNLDFTQRNPPLVLPKHKKNGKRDEFDVVADAVNHMSTSLSDTVLNLRNAEQDLKGLLRERSELLNKEREHKEELEEKVLARTQELTDSEEALKQSHNHLKNILETSPIAVGVYNPSQKKLTFSNKTCANMFGFNMEAWLDHDPVASWKHEQERKECIEEYRKSGRVSTREVLLVRNDASEFWALLTWERIFYQDQKQILFWIVDITEQKRILLQMEQAKAMAEQATRFKSEFLAHMSHEIRTPMNAVVGFSHLALQTELSEQQHDYVNKIQLAGHNLLRVINDILDLSKIEAGKICVESIEFSLDDVLEHVCDLLRLKAEDKGLEMLMFHPWDIPRQLKGDPLRLGQVLTNLVSNAIKFTESGLVSIQVSEVNRSADSIMLQFSVEDTGIGLSESEITHIFQPFGQADSSTTRRFGGSGLGLAISKQLVELMDGEISVCSTKGQGACFSFSCKFELVEPDDVTENMLSSIHGRRVLIVDDSEASRDVLSSIVCNFGMYCYTVESGEEAIAELERNHASSEPDYDLLLLDWHMPGIDGLECAKKIRLMSEERPLPALVMVTAHHQETVLPKISADYLDGFLLKPVSPSLLLSSILNALQLSSALPMRHQPLSSPDVEALEGILGAQVLLVEDNVINQQVATEMLEGLGLKISSAVNGEVAVQRAKETLFDLILMDIQMPVMDGLQATREIREIPEYAQVPIVAMTANAMQEDYDNSIQAGMNDHINKPIEPAVLFNVLSKWIKAGSYHPPSQADDQQLPHIPSLDCQSALMRLNGNRALFIKLLDQFVDEQQDSFEVIRELLEKGQTEQAADRAHTYAGLVGNLGGNELCAIAKEIECHLRREETTEVTQLIKESVSLHTSLLADIKPVLNGADTPKLAITNEGTTDFSALIGQMRELLRQGDSEALKQITKLQHAVDGHCSDLMQDLEHAVEEFEFDRALEILGLLEEAMLKA